MKFNTIFQVSKITYLFLTSFSFNNCLGTFLLYTSKVVLLVSKVHVVPFDNILKKFPRKRVEMEKYILEFSKESGLSATTKILLVRRIKVMKALYWSNKYHVECKKNDSQLIIDESNLSWMNGKDEAEIANCSKILYESKNVKQATNKNTNKVSDEDCTDDEMVHNETKQCSVSQLQHIAAQDNSNESESIEYIGILGDNESSVNNTFAKAQIEKLKKIYENTVPEDKRNYMLPWPSVSKEPKNEFKGIFVNIFSWLFPGVIGDINEPKRTSTEIQFKVLANYLLNYWDGKFVKDPIWCFYTENMRQRRENMSSGSIF